MPWGTLVMSNVSLTLLIHSMEAGLVPVCTAVEGLGCPSTSVFLSLSCIVSSALTVLVQLPGASEIPANNRALA